MAKKVDSPNKWEQLFVRLLSRYTGAAPEALVAVLCPLHVPIATLDKTIVKLRGQNHYRGSFTVRITEENETWIVLGRTGKFVPATHQAGGIWREIAKGRIIGVDRTAGIATGEVYTGGRRRDLEQALDVLQPSDYLEIDQFGAAAKVLSGLVEYSFVQVAKDAGYKVWRMPEDMAKHLGSYLNFDYEIEKGGVKKKVEVKSIWGTNTKFARLIHSRSTKKPKGDPSTWLPEQRRARPADHVGVGCSAKRISPRSRSGSAG